MLFSRLLYNYYTTGWHANKNQPLDQHLLKEVEKQVHGKKVDRTRGRVFFCENLPCWFWTGKQTGTHFWLKLLEDIRQPSSSYVVEAVYVWYFWIFLKVGSTLASDLCLRISVNVGLLPWCKICYFSFMFFAITSVLFAPNLKWTR